MKLLKNFFISKN